MFGSPFNFRPNDWYWLAADGRIYSSARNALVYPYDSGYLAFSTAYSTSGTPWPVDLNGQQTAAALAVVMAQYGITLSFS